ncbi:hypothetical protein [Gordonia sp. CPCC 205333]|uniref:hypothetical protein n=1 Tax=Gordonia sp. CPCC 205333 TaxID=3140790 RepID=UPI003AF3F01A
MAESQPPTKHDPLGELMAGVERYLAGLPDDAYQGLIAAVEKARGAEPATEGTPAPTEYPGNWDVATHKAGK